MSKNTFYVLVCGGRNYKDKDRLTKVMDKFKEDIAQGSELCVVHGAAKGADSLAGEWALMNECITAEFEADWDTHGRSAGPIRNRKMLDFLLNNKSAGSDIAVVAFPGGKGTDNMCDIAKKANVTVYRML